MLVERKVSKIKLITLILSLGVIPLAFSTWIFLAPRQKFVEAGKESFLPFYCQGYFYKLLAALAALILIIFFFKKGRDSGRK
jgi:hypothetical protein